MAHIPLPGPPRISSGFVEGLWAVILDTYWGAGSYQWFILGFRLGFARWSSGLEALGLQHARLPLITKSRFIVASYYKVLYINYG